MGLFFLKATADIMAGCIPAVVVVVGGGVDFLLFILCLVLLTGISAGFFFLLTYC